MISQNIPISLFQVKKKWLKGVLQEWKGWFSLRFWGEFFECFFWHTNLCNFVRLKKQNLNLKGIIEKYVVCISIFLLKKRVQRRGVCKIALKAHCYLKKVYYYYEKVL